MSVGILIEPAIFYKKVRTGLPIFFGFGSNCTPECRCNIVPPRYLYINKDLRIESRSEAVSLAGSVEITYHRPNKPCVVSNLLDR